MGFPATTSSLLPTTRRAPSHSPIPLRGRRPPIIIRASWPRGQHQPRSSRRRWWHWENWETQIERNLPCGLSYPLFSPRADESAWLIHLPQEPSRISGGRRRVPVQLADRPTCKTPQEIGAAEAGESEGHGWANWAIRSDRISSLFTTHHCPVKAFRQIPSIPAAS